MVSVHSDEPEYVLKPTGDHVSFCRLLADECGADVVWSNHPHVVQPWEEYRTKDGRKSLIMLANGNTISGQRRDPQFSRPETIRDYTGEGILMRAEFERKPGGNVELKSFEPLLVTTLTAADGRYVLRFLDDGLLDALDRAEYTKWRDYLERRKKLMEEYLPW